MIGNQLLALSRRLVAAALLVGVWHNVGLPRSASGEPYRAPVRDEDHIFRRYTRSWTDLKTQNVVMQQRDYSCGAAALATLIKYHLGDHATETELLEETIRMLTLDEMRDRIQNGLSLTDLRRVAVRKGYRATIGRLEYAKLRESKVPLVVGIIVNEFDHFVVYRGMDAHYVYLADPARGNVRVPIPDFLKQWQKNAVLVVVKPGDERRTKSALSVRGEEIYHGETNRYFLRDRVSASIPNVDVTR